MAEKISVQIALEGGQLIQQQLADIGEAGQKAFVQISQSAEQVGFRNIKPEEVTAKLKELGVEGPAAIKKVQQAVQQAARLETLVQGIQSVENAMVALGRAAIPVGVALTAAFVAASKATIAFAETVNKASDEAVKLGISLAQLKKYQEDFRQLGVFGEDAAKAIGNFQKEMEKQIAQADPGSSLRLFGSALQLTQEQMGPFIEKLRQMPDGLERTNAAIAAFGPAGLAMVQSFRAAEGSMSDAEKKAYDLGQALGNLNQAWKDLGTVALAPLITPELNQIAEALRAVQNVINNFSWTAFGEAGVQSALALTNALNPIPGYIQKIIQALAGLDWSKLAGPAITGGEAGAVPGMAGGGLIGGRGSGTSDSNLAWLSRGEHIMPARVVSQPGVLSFLEALRRGGRIPGYAAGGPVAGAAPVAGQLSGNLDSMVQALDKAVVDIGAAMSDVVQKLGDLSNTINNAFSDLINQHSANLRTVQDSLVKVRNDILKLQQRASGKASGGLLGGYGTGTSDSNLAWVSRGEYITPAGAVRRPGVLAFLEALRRSGGNLSAVLDGMGRFALGGLVPGGGGVNLGTLTLGLPSGGSVTVRASSSVADQLRKEAALAQVRSGGRKPSRYS